MNFTEHDVIVIHEELAAIRERVHKLILGREIAVSYRLDQKHNLRLLEKLAAWRRKKRFDRSEILAERQRRIKGHVCLADGRNTLK